MKEIPLNQGLVAFVDDDDYELVSALTWHVSRRRGRIYARNRKSTYMHRLILGTTKGETDHIDGNGLNNQRSNLRAVTISQNQYNAKLRIDNTSGFKGVGKEPRRDRWHARIKINGRDVQLGLFDTPQEAARAYDRKAIEVRGDYARLNFPRSDYGI